MRNNNIECPICLTETSNYFTLSCNHSFDYYCLQNLLYLKIMSDTDILCPYCRTKINTKDINKICKKWVFLNYNNLPRIKNINIFSIKKKLKFSNIIELEYNSFILKTTIFLPIIKNIPVFYFSPVFNDSVLIKTDNFINFLNFFSENNTIYEEKIEKYYFFMDCYIKNKKWNKFISRNIKKFLKKKIKNYDIKNTDLYKKINYSKYKMRFYIKNPNKIVTYNLKNKVYINNFIYLKDVKFRCLFKIFILQSPSDIYLINELCELYYI